MSDEPPGYSNSRMGEHISPTASGGISIPPLKLPPLKNNDPYNNISPPQVSSCCSPSLKQASTSPSTSSSSQYGSSGGIMFPSMSSVNQYAPHNGHDRMAESFMNSFNGNGGFVITAKMGNSPNSQFIDKSFLSKILPPSSSSVSYGSQKSDQSSSSHVSSPLSPSLLLSNYKEFANPTTSNDLKSNEVELNGDSNHTDSHTEKTIVEEASSTSSTPSFADSQTLRTKPNPISSRIPPPLPGRKPTSKAAGEEKQIEVLSNGEKVENVEKVEINGKKVGEVESETPKQRRAPGKPKRYQHSEESSSIRNKQNVHIIWENGDEESENDEKPKRKRAKRKAKTTALGNESFHNYDDLGPMPKRRKSVSEIKLTNVASDFKDDSFPILPSSEVINEKLVDLTGEKPKKRKRKPKPTDDNHLDVLQSSSIDSTNNLTNIIKTNDVPTSSIPEQEKEPEAEKSDSFLAISEIAEMLKRDEELVEKIPNSSNFATSVMIPVNPSVVKNNIETLKVSRKDLVENQQIVSASVPIASTSTAEFPRSEPVENGHSSSDEIEPKRKKGRPPKKVRLHHFSKQEKQSRIDIEKVNRLKQEAAKVLELRRPRLPQQDIQEDSDIDGENEVELVVKKKKEEEKVEGKKINEKKIPMEAVPKSIEVMVRVRNEDGSFGMHAVDLPRDLEMERQFVDSLVESGHTLEEAEEELARRLATANEKAATILEEEELYAKIGQIGQLIEGDDVPEGMMETFEELLAESGLNDKMVESIMKGEEEMTKASHKEEYQKSKDKFKNLVFENECYQEELRNSQRKLLKLTRDNNFLLDRLMHYEDENNISNDDDESLSGQEEIEESENEGDSSEESSESDGTVEDESGTEESEDEGEDEDEEGEEGVEKIAAPPPPPREEREYSPVLFSMPGRRVFNDTDATPPETPSGSEDEDEGPQDEDDGPEEEFEPDFEDEEEEDDYFPEDDSNLGSDIPMYEFDSDEEFEDEMYSEFDSELDEEDYENFFDANQPSTSGIPPVECFSPSERNFYLRPNLYNALVSNNQAVPSESSTRLNSVPVEDNPNPGHFFTSNDIEKQFEVMKEKFGEVEVVKKKPKRTKKKKMNEPISETTELQVSTDNVEKANELLPESNKPVENHEIPLDCQLKPLVRSDSIVVKAGNMTIPVEVRPESGKRSTELFISAKDYDRYIQTLILLDTIDDMRPSTPKTVDFVPIPLPILQLSDIAFIDEPPDHSLQGDAHTDSSLELNKDLPKPSSSDNSEEMTRDVDATIEPIPTVSSNDSEETTVVEETKPEVLEDSEENSPESDKPRDEEVEVEDQGINSVERGIMPVEDSSPEAAELVEDTAGVENLEQAPFTTLVEYVPSEETVTENVSCGSSSSGVLNDDLGSSNLNDFSMADADLEKRLVESQTPSEVSKTPSSPEVSERGQVPSSEAFVTAKGSVVNSPTDESSVLPLEEEVAEDHSEETHTSSIAVSEMVQPEKSIECVLEFVLNPVVEAVSQKDQPTPIEVSSPLLTTSHSEPSEESVKPVEKDVKEGPTFCDLNPVPVAQLPTESFENKLLIEKLNQNVVPIAQEPSILENQLPETISTVESWDNQSIEKAVLEPLQLSSEASENPVSIEESIQNDPCAEIPITVLPPHFSQVPSTSENIIPPSGSEPLDSQPIEQALLEPSRLLSEDSENPVLIEKTVRNVIPISSLPSKHSQVPSTSVIVPAPPGTESADNPPIEHSFLEPTRIPSEFSQILTVNTSDDVSAFQEPVILTTELSTKKSPVPSHSTGASPSEPKTPSSSISESSESSSDSEPEPEPQPEPVSKIFERLLSASDNIKRVSVSTPTSPSGAVLLLNPGTLSSSPLSLPNTSTTRRSFPGASRLSMIADRLSAKAVQSAVSSIGGPSTSALLCVVSNQPIIEGAQRPDSSIEPSTSSGQLQQESSSQSDSTTAHTQVALKSPIPTPSAQESVVVHESIASIHSPEAEIEKTSSSSESPIETTRVASSIQVEPVEMQHEELVMNQIDPEPISMSAENYRPKGRPRGSKNRRGRGIGLLRRASRKPTKPPTDSPIENKDEGDEGSDEFD